MSAEYGSSGPAGIFVVGDHAKMMEAAKTNPYLAKLMPKTPVSDGKKMTHEGSGEPENKAEMYEDWRQALKLEGEKNDRKDGSGVLFDIVILGDKTGANQEKIGLEAIEGTNMAAPQKSVTGGRLKGKARKEARLRQTSQATASFTYTTPTKNEDGSRPSDRAGVETQGSEAREESSVPHSVGARPESTSTIGLEPMLEQLLKGVPAITMTDRDYTDSDSAATTTAEKLKEAAKADLIPSDPLTRDHFGFNRASTVEEESNLLGLYRGLLILLPDPPSTKTVQLWQERNKIAGGIYHTYKTQHGRSGYFNWFKKNQHIVDPSKINPQGQMSQP